MEDMADKGAELCLQNGGDDGNTPEKDEAEEEEEDDNEEEEEEEEDEEEEEEEDEEEEEEEDGWKTFEDVRGSLPYEEDRDKVVAIPDGVEPDFPAAAAPVLEDGVGDCERWW